MRTYYLRADSAQQMGAALVASGLFDFGSMQFAPGVDYFSIGVIQKNTGQTQQVTVGDETLTDPVFAPVPGFHANIRGITEEQAAMLPVIDDPKTPSYVFSE